ncbi:MAG: hypothetical protein NVS9B7_30180 [Flavisolibacter sp.]
MATLTNSPLSTLYSQLEFSGIKDSFDTVLSIDAVKKYKPANESYLYASKSLGVSNEEIIMVAAHGWDITGAMSVGMWGAFLERKGQALYSLSAPPSYRGRSLIELASQIIGRNP